MAKYRVVARETRRYEVEVEANSPDEAEIEAEGIPPHEWKDDCEYYDFSISSAEKIENQNEKPV